LKRAALVEARLLLGLEGDVLLTFVQLKWLIGF